jgi:flagellin
MSIYINSNTASMNAQRNLGNAQRALASNLSHLSSGERIETAADDAAGLGISEKMKANIASYQQASRNANDGVSMIQVAEGSMDQQAGILTRLRELATQSANGTLSDGTDRAYIDNESKELLGELDRISAVTDFNGTKMLGANSGSVSMQVDLGSTSNDTISLNFTKTDSTSLGVKYGDATNGVDLSTAAGASTALGNIDKAIDALSKTRATLGASQNRLQVTIDNLATSTQNLSDANSRIRDVDVASETAAMTRNQILQQAGVAVLAQANQLPSAALSLIGGR